MACIETITHSAEETLSCGRSLGQTLALGSIVCFFGDLAAGKTTFIKGLVSGAAGEHWEQAVNSPTFVYLNIYEGSKTIYHFDLYRLQSTPEFLAMGFDEFLHNAGICCFEWAERIQDLLPTACIRVKLSHVDENTRRITIHDGH